MSTCSGESNISRRRGVDLVGGVDSGGSYVSKILKLERKESGPLDPPMTFQCKKAYTHTNFETQKERIWTLRSANDISV